jgi:hypothetical protein
MLFAFLTLSKVKKLSPNDCDFMVTGLLMQMMGLMVGKVFLSFWDMEIYRRVQMSPSLHSTMNPSVLPHSIFVKIILIYTSVYA